MKLTQFACALLAGAALSTGARAGGVPHLDHVWVLMMENHGADQILNNPYAPFINQEALSANLAGNYFAVAHPSLTNYLELVGGSNFGVQDDNTPDWHDTTCVPNIASGVVNDEANPNPICPIAGTGMDAATPAVDYTNETSGPPGVININGTRFYAPAPTVGVTIADQLTAVGKSWKSYQESLPLVGADNVNNANGLFTDTYNFDTLEQSQGETDSAVVALYASKHNPFVYFASVQASGLANIAPFDGATGLYGDLASGHVPAFSFIAPNQCNDMHGKSGAGPFCAYDPSDNGTQDGLNPGLIAAGDQTVQKIVTAIKASPVWAKGHNAIVILWDENDYSVKPIVNQVVTIVDKNYGKTGVQSGRFYTHFNLLNTIETGLGLPCLNHACDSTAYTMSDLFN